MTRTRSNVEIAFFWTHHYLELNKLKTLHAMAPPETYRRGKKKIEFMFVSFGIPYLSPRVGLSLMRMV